MLGLNSHFLFFIVFVFVFAFVFVIVIPGASVDSTCHELLEYVWFYGSVKHIYGAVQLIKIFDALGLTEMDGRTKEFQDVLGDLDNTEILLLYFDFFLCSFLKIFYRNPSSVQGVRGSEGKFHVLPNSSYTRVDTLAD